MFWKISISILESFENYFINILRNISENSENYAESLENHFKIFEKIFRNFEKYFGHFREVCWKISENNFQKYSVNPE